MFWVIGGIALLVLGCFLIEPIMDLDSFGLASLGLISVTSMMTFGVIMMFMPLILSDVEEEFNYAESCESIGGSYQIIGTEWDGEYETNIYGCVKE